MLQPLPLPTHAALLLRAEPSAATIRIYLTLLQLQRIAPFGAKRFFPVRVADLARLADLKPRAVFTAMERLVALGLI